MWRDYNISIGTLVREKMFRFLNIDCKPLHQKNTDEESWREYDKKGRCIHYIDSFGYEEYYEYGENGKVLVRGPFGNVLR